MLHNDSLNKGGRIFVATAVNMTMLGKGLMGHMPQS